MSEQIIQLAQVNDPIINNLVDTENRLNELNQEVGAIVQDYQTVQKPETSFFNFDNPFFLLILAGLFVLAFALWFLQQELKRAKPKKEKVITPEKNIVKTIPEVKQKTAEPEKIEKTKTKISKKKKGRTIKVVKIK